MDEQGTETTVRVATHDDLDFLVEMAVEVRNAEVSRGKTGYVPDYKEFIKQLYLFFDGALKDDQWVGLIAEKEGQPVGAALGKIEPLELFCDPPVQGAIALLAVKEEHRRERVGVVLVGALEAIFSELGIRKVTADVYQGNTEPQWGLLRCGYRYEYVRLARDIASLPEVQRNELRQKQRQV